ncbi:MAG: hypothetical protein ACYC1P_03900, partial [Gaiellaceae bacterium]
MPPSAFPNTITSKQTLDVRDSLPRPRERLFGSYEPEDEAQHRPDPLSITGEPLPRNGPQTTISSLSAPADAHSEMLAIYHPMGPNKAFENARGIAYELNKEWVAPYVDVHRDFHLLTRLFYDLSPLVLDGVMSTTALQYIKDTVIEQEKERSISLNYNSIKEYSSRHRLSFAPPARTREQIDWEQNTRAANWPTIRDRSNWTRQQVSELRNLSNFHAAHSSAR